MNPGPEADRVLLSYMRDCLDRIREYTNSERSRFDASRLVQDAVIRNLQTLVESSQRLSSEIKGTEPQIPWRELAGFRNVMVFDAVIFHAAKPTIRSPKEVKPYYFYFMTRNEILMWRKFCPPVKFLKSVRWTILRQSRQIARMKDSPAHVDAVLDGIWDGLRGKGGGYQRAENRSRLGRLLALGLTRVA